MNYTHKKKEKKNLTQKKGKGKSKKAKGKSKRDITEEELKAFEISRNEFEMLHAQSNKSKTFSNIRASLKKKDIEVFLKKHNIYVPSRVNKPFLLDIYLNPTHMIVTTEKKSKIMARLSTLQAAAVKDYVDLNYEIIQPEFTPSDREKKKLIWGIKTLPNGKTSSAFSDEQVDIRLGDHIFGMREGLKIYNILGSNSEWNLVPCTPKENVSWKKINLLPNNSKISKEEYKNLQSKKLVYDKFSNEEIEIFDSETYNKYKKFEEWKKYCDSKNVRLYWINGVQINNLVTEKILEKLLELDTSLKALPKVDQTRQIKATEKELSNISDDNTSESIESNDDDLIE